MNKLYQILKIIVPRFAGFLKKISSIGSLEHAVGELSEKIEQLEKRCNDLESLVYLNIHLVNQANEEKDRN